MRKIFIVSAIEKRLQELQRKLSEIAEIPRILSSTLATVSQTFDKLTTTLPTTAPPTNLRHYCQKGNDYCPPFCAGEEQKRKFSYDEDIFDYELSDDDEREGEIAKGNGFDAKEAYLQLKRYAARQRKSKEITPESDYASECNYQTQEIEQQAQDNELSVTEYENSDTLWGEGNCHRNVAGTSVTSNEGDDDTEKSCDMYEEFNLSLLQTPFAQVYNESDIEEYDDDDDDENDADDVVVAIKGSESGHNEEDFLTATLTWNLPNKLKLQMNNKDDDDKDDDNDDSAILQEEDRGRDDEDKVNVVQLNVECRNLHLKAGTPEKEQKLDKLERSWPWADREKIIYKQSTCHLVPHKPLGLIEKRIQLLAQRNLLEHIGKVKNTP